jgi:hypothetical protein
MINLNARSFVEQFQEIGARWRRTITKFIQPPLDGQPVRLTEASKLLLLIALIAGLAIWVYWPVLTAQVVGLDDTQYLMDNPLVQNPGFDSIKRFFTEVLNPSTVTGYYQPLTMVSLMFDYLLDPQFENLKIFHRTSLILHIMTMAAIVVLLFLLFKNIWAAAAVGLLFVLHPLTVEPVAWIAERKTLLAAFFSIASLVYYVYFNQTNKRTCFILSLLLYLAALLSKPSSIPLPILMLLIDFWPIQHINGKRFFEKWPFYILAVLFAGITFFSQKNAAGVVMPGQNPIFLEGFSVLTVFQIIAHNFIFYFTKIIWPVNLMVRYPIPNPFSFANPIIVAETLIFVILSVSSLLILKKTRSSLTTILFFIIAISPTMGVIGFTTVLTADMYAYLPSLGYMILFAWILTKTANFFKTHKKSIIVWFLILAVLLSLLLLEANATRNYLALWQEPELINRYMLKLDPRNPQLYNMLAMTLRKKSGHNKEIISLYEKAIQLTPTNVDRYIDLGNFYVQIGENDKGISLFEKSIELGSHNLLIYVDLGIAYFHKKQYDKAVYFLEYALKMYPQASKVYLILGDVYRYQGKRAIAEEYYQKALAPETSKK